MPGANIEAAAWKDALQQSADSGDVVQTDPSRKSLIAKIPESEMGSRYQARPASMLAKYKPAMGRRKSARG